MNIRTANGINRFVAALPSRIVTSIVQAKPIGICNRPLYGDYCQNTFY